MSLIRSRLTLKLKQSHTESILVLCWDSNVENHILQVFAPETKYLAVNILIVTSMVYPFLDFRYIQDFEYLYYYYPKVQYLRPFETTIAIDLFSFLPASLTLQDQLENIS